MNLTDPIVSYSNYSVLLNLILLYLTYLNVILLFWKLICYLLYLWIPIQNLITVASLYLVTEISKFTKIVKIKENHGTKISWVGDLGFFVYNDFGNKPPYAKILISRNFTALRQFIYNAGWDTTWEKQNL